MCPLQQDIDNVCNMIRDGAPRGGRQLIVHALYANLPWGMQIKAMTPIRWSRVRRVLGRRTARRRCHVFDAHDLSCSIAEVSSLERWW